MFEQRSGPVDVLANRHQQNEQIVTKTGADSSRLQMLYAQATENFIQHVYATEDTLY